MGKYTNGAANDKKYITKDYEKDGFASQLNIRVNINIMIFVIMVSKQKQINNQSLLRFCGGHFIVNSMELCDVTWFSNRQCIKRCDKEEGMTHLSRYYNYMIPQGLQPQPLLLVPSWFYNFLPTHPHCASHALLLTVLEHPSFTTIFPNTLRPIINFSFVLGPKSEVPEH